MELRRLSLYLALFVLAICSQSCSDAHAMHKRGTDDIYDDDGLMGDEATDDETQNDGEGNDAEDVNDVPELILTKSTPYNITRGKSIRLECKVHPNNGPVIQWLKDNQQIFLGKNPTKDNLPSRIHLSTDPSDHDLTISDIQPSDSGVYTCKVMQLDPISKVDHDIHVVEKPRIKSFKASDNGVVKEGSDLLLTCDVAGSPPPEILWSYQIGNMNIPLREMNATFTLNTAFIKNIKRDKAGTYHCYALNNFGHTEATINVSVLHKPRVFVHKTVVNSALEIEAVLQCSAHAQPVPRITWYKDGHIIDEASTRYVITSDGPNSNLSFTPHEDADFGTFTCVGKNEHGKHNNSIELVQRPVVEDLELEGNKLTWKIQSHQPLEQIELQLRGSNGVPTQISVPVPEKSGHEQDIVYLLDDFDQGTYEVVVKAKNSKEWSQASEPVVVNYEAPLPIQTASVYHANSHSIRPSTGVALSTVFMYLLVRLI